MTTREPPPQEVGDDISMLIRTLRETDQELQDLTGGEIDAVLDRDGRSFLLQRAQEKIRYEEAARQAGILDALPAHVALLDSLGNIVCVNEAWHRYGQENESCDPSNGVGRNYLEVCEKASEQGADGAGEVAAGIRSVINGTSTGYSFEYPCPAPNQQRWFLLTVTPQSNRFPSGVVVMHLEVTQRRHSDEAHWRFAATMDAVADAIYLVDRDSMSFVHVNDAGCRLHGLTRTVLLASQPWTFTSNSRDELERIYDSIIKSGVDPKPIESSRSLADGSVRWFELRRHAQFSSDRWSVITLVRDVTDRKEAEARIAYLNRVYAVLSGINTLIVRVRDRQALFDQACRIAVDLGGFPVAWIGMLDDAGAKIVMVASAGLDDEYRREIEQRLEPSSDQPLGGSLAARAVRERRSCLSNDVQSDPSILLPKQLQKLGIQSVAVLPLIVSDRCVGTLSIYAGEKEFFHSDEMKLLTELTGDISFAVDYIEKQERLDYLAYYDVLTGLANRSLFVDRVEQYMRGAVSGESKLALAVIDLERFRIVNESLGRSGGDALLRLVAECLKRNAGDAGLLTRLDADHFAVVMPEVGSDQNLGRKLEQLMDALTNCPFRLNDAFFRMGAKAGAAVFPDGGADADTLLKSAEAALKSAKRSGDRYRLHTATMTEGSAQKLTLENKLRQAIDREEFVLHYQPKLRLADGRLMGAEALIRWNDPLAGMVPPSQFIPILEETGLIYEVGRWALSKAIADYVRWRDTGLISPRIAVNVSPRQLHDSGFISHVKAAIGVDSLAAQGLELEITESLVMEDVKNSIASLRAARDLGVKIAIDDFGTGFSSLSYLSKLPIDTLKIDRTFVVDMTAGPQGMALVSTIINLAHALGLNVVAEGVETEEQSRLLRLLNCNEAQGYLFSKPIPSATFESRYLTPAVGDLCA